MTLQEKLNKKYEVKEKRRKNRVNIKLGKRVYKQGVEDYIRFKFDNKPIKP